MEHWARGAGEPEGRAGSIVRLPSRCFCLSEPLGEGPNGPTWLAHLADGSPVVAKALSADTALLERAAGLGGPYLVTQTVVSQAGTTWVLTDVDTSVPLARLPQRMRQGVVVAVGIGILSALARLHQDGLWHGSLKLENVLIDPDGSVRLTHYALTSPQTESERAATRLADVRAAGALLSDLLRARAARAGDSGTPSELAKALHSIATMRRHRWSGYEATFACVTLWEAAGRTWSARSREQAVAQLAALSARLSEGVPGARDRAAPPPAAAARPPRRRRAGVTSRASGGPEQTQTTAYLPGRVPSQGRRAVSLERLAQVEALTPAQVVTVAFDLLAALQGQGRAGASPGILAAGRVRVSETGEAEIAGDPEPSAADAEGGAQAVGALARDLLGRVPADSAESTEVELALEALALGALGRTPGAAHTGLRDRLWLLASPARMEQTRMELGALVSSVHTKVAEPAVRPVVAEKAIPRPVPAPAPTRRRLGPQGRILVAALASVAVTGTAVLAGLGVAMVASPPAHEVPARPAPPPAVAAVQQVPDSPPAAPAPAAVAAAPGPPVVAPPAAGLVRGVTLNSTGCAAGKACTAHATIRFAGAQSATPLAWTVRFYDSCGGPALTLATASYTAPAGWDTVEFDSAVSIPASAPSGWLVAVTSRPGEAASNATAIGGRSC